MNKWSRTLITVVAAVSLTAVGLSASAAPPPAPVPPSVPTTASSVPGNVQAQSPRPPSRAESVYVAITPCRIVDTRVTGNPFGNNAIRTYYVGGNFGFTAQGGHNGGCGIPIGATAIAATMTATGPTGNGFMRAWPQNLSEPAATQLSYSSHVSTGTGATLSIQKNSALSLRVKNYGGPTNLVIDVAGYYAQQIEGMVGSDGSIYSGSDRLISATVINPGVYRVTFDSDVSYCTPTVTAYSGKGVYASAYAFAGTSVYVYTWYISGTTHLETANSYYFYISVIC